MNKPWNSYLYLHLLFFLYISINRPSSKPICDQQFLGEAQSSTAAY
ncbi:hypothetical protein [Cardinium endosymbiont of Dermatophagoides farinae]|nr:hypothetical protein [Cardinium endosymbiont of Dermatophagoides farinae]